MKIAICFAGFLRSFPVTIGNWNYRLRHYDCDFFIHAPNIYYTPSEEKTYDAYEKQQVDLNFLHDCFGLKLKGLNLFNYDAQKFKKMAIEHNMPEVSFSCRNGLEKQYSYRVLSYQYNIQEVIKMVISNNVNYDLIMLTRSDINLYEDFDFSVLDLNKINYPVYHGLNFQGELKNGVAEVIATPYKFNDQVLIGTPEKMYIFKNIYDCIPDYFNEGIVINSETLLGFHCLKNNISFDTAPFIKYDILRFAQQ